ncbi:MAG: protein-glutamate O-methyltransferase CheR [Mariprofundaceae bacterium]|nr:protein-glutamate O-methyltransferase CheR [Mariprofundaceae bacterium]
MSLRPELFRYLREFLECKSGLVLDDSKLYLIRSRVQTLLRNFEIADMDTLAQQIKRDENGKLAHCFIDEMTTNETLFFRDAYPFEALKTLVFPELTHAGNGNESIRIWSAASSRGQEPYSIAMTASEAVPMADKRVFILATDLSESAIAYAREAKYTQMEVQRGMPVQQLVRFFNQEGIDWFIRDELKEMLTFQTANLVGDSLIGQVRRFGPFDIVFCRNVLIYFAPEERKKVIDRLARSMKKGGYLFTGATETPEGHNSKWECMMFKGKRIWKLL